MPVRKFRSFEEAREALWADVIDDAYLARLAALWERSSALSPRRFPPGVYKYRSIADPARDWPID